MGNSRLNTLLSSEEKARELVEEATKEARRIRTGIPAQISSIESEYDIKLKNLEEEGLKKVNGEIKDLKIKQQAILVKGKKQLDSQSHKIVPKALELLHSALEVEKG